MVMGALSGCATPYHPIPFDHATSGVSKLQIVDDTMPATAHIRKLATNGQNVASSTGGLGLAGLVVGLAAAGIEAGIANDQNSKINAALATQGFDGKATFDEAFQTDLHTQNFDTSPLKIARDGSHGFVTVTPLKSATAGNAVLDVDGYGYGYQQVGGTKWRPYVVISVKMSDANDPTKILLDNRVEYNAVVPGTLTVSIPGDDAYAFDKIEDIQANPAKAAEGLKAALVASAHATAQLLK